MLEPTEPLPTMREIVDCAALCALTYNYWDDAEEKEDFAQRNLRQRRPLPQTVVEDMENRFDVVERRRFPSGLDVKCFTEKGAQRLFIATDGTDLVSPCRVERFADLRNCIALMFGRRPAQAADFIAFAQQMKRDYPGWSRIGTGHSLGGYVQQLAVANTPTLFDRVLVFNAPGFWPFAREVRKLKGKRLSHVYSFSAREPITLLGRQIGKRVWLPGHYNHSITSTSTFLSTRMSKGYAVVHTGSVIRLDGPNVNISETHARD